MDTKNAKMLPLLMLALGAVLTIYALILDFTKATGELRGLFWA